tara:strand:- start:1041 stop:1484 length:444 start_codon:yes stop_codon:yes gene_type:complete
MILEYFIIFTLSLLTRIILGFVNYTKSLALELSDNKDGTSFQNAITPSWFPALALSAYILSVFVIVSGFIKSSFVTGMIYLGIYFLTLIIVGVTLFKPNSLSPLAKLFYHIVLNSIVKKQINYKKKNDEVKAQTMETVLKKFKEAYK